MRSVLIGLLTVLIAVSVSVGQSAIIENGNLLLHTKDGIATTIELNKSRVSPIEGTNRFKKIRVTNGIRTKGIDRIVFIETQMIGAVSDSSTVEMYGISSISSRISIIRYNGDKLWDIFVDYQANPEDYGATILDVELARQSGHLAIWVGSKTVHGTATSAYHLYGPRNPIPGHYQLYDPEGNLLFTFNIDSLDVSTVYNLSISEGGKYAGIAVQNRQYRYAAIVMDVDNGEVIWGEHQNRRLLAIKDDGTLIFGGTLEQGTTNITIEKLRESKL